MIWCFNKALLYGQVNQLALKLHWLKFNFESFFGQLANSYFRSYQCLSFVMTNSVTHLHFVLAFQWNKLDCLSSFKKLEFITFTRSLVSPISSPTSLSWLWSPDNANFLSNEIKQAGMECVHVCNHHGALYCKVYSQQTLETLIVRIMAEWRGALN